jgi:hypothetical protein
MNWLRVVLRVVTSEVFMEPLIIALISYGVRIYGKSHKYRVLMDTAVDIVDYIEEHYKEWGIRGSKKMEKFMELFTEEYKKRIGRKPSKTDLEMARVRAEAQVQRIRRQNSKK